MKLFPKKSRRGWEVEEEGEEISGTKERERIKLRNRYNMRDFYGR